MKKLISLLLASTLFLSLCVCGSNALSEPDASKLKTLLVTDSGDVDDGSFNQACFEAMKSFCEKNDIEYQYLQPENETTEAQLQAIRAGIAAGYHVVILPGYSFASAAVQAAQEFPEVRFVAIDVSKEDLDAAAGAEGFFAANLCCVIYQEEIAGYLAGYAAVKLGYSKLGFLGGVDTPAVRRFGYGYAKGADAAAAEVGEAIELRYAYAGTFVANDGITAQMNQWYTEGTQVVFSCGGGIFHSVAAAAAANSGKMIGVDVDQRSLIDGEYGEGITVTSAMKGVQTTVTDILTAIRLGLWAEYGGMTHSLGIISTVNTSLNYVQLPLESTQWDYAFTQRDYLELVSGIDSGNVDVSVDPAADQPQAERIRLVFEGTLG